MKLSSSAIFLATVGTANAFVIPNVHANGFTRHSVVSDPMVSEVVVNGASSPLMPAEPQQLKTVTVSDAAPVASVQTKIAETKPQVTKAATPTGGNVLLPGRYDSIDYSIALPFFPRPAKLDGSHAGDNGFDPLGFTEDYDIYYLQECELRHARLAMLAVVGWPLSELVAPDVLLQDGRAPSVLNGFTPLTGAATLFAFAVFGLFEINTWNRRTIGTKLGETHLKDMQNIWGVGVAGDYNFDPAGLYNSLGDDAVGRKAIRDVEITQGRWAMLGITYFAWIEAISGKPVASHNIFFEPNPELPILALALLGFSAFFEVSDPKQFPIKIQKTRLALELDEWIERRKEGEEGRQ